MAHHCTRCRKPIGLMDRFSYAPASGRCGPCEKAVRAALPGFRRAFIDATADGVISDAEWSSLVNGLAQHGIPPAEAYASVRSEALDLVERTLAFATNDGRIDDGDVRHLEALCRALHLPDKTIRSIGERVGYLRMLLDIRAGRLPSIRTRARLEAGDIPHFEAPAEYWKLHLKRPKSESGTILATSQNLFFFSPKGGQAIPWSKVMRTAVSAGGLMVELSRRSGSGLYMVPDPIYAEAIVDTLVRISKREALGDGSAADRRRIPRAVRIAVWQRDQARCVECSARTYLEFDHVIPVAKGGSNTEANVQLLCRGCNLKKSDRI